MATINYNGMELEEVTTPQIFDPPRKCVVWDDNTTNWKTAEIIAIFAPSSKLQYKALSKSANFYKHCALLPDPPKQRRATWLEVARWCATGNGLVYDTYRDRIDTGIMFKSFEGDEPIMDKIKVRKWSDTEWHEPDVFYMGLEDK
jgi:hypothetical protein